MSTQVPSPPKTEASARSAAGAAATPIDGDSGGENGADGGTKHAVTVRTAHEDDVKGELSYRRVSMARYGS